MTTNEQQDQAKVNEEAAKPKGRALKLDPAPIAPGEIGQLIVKLPSSADLLGVQIDEERGEVVRIIAGPYNCPTKDAEAEGRDHTDIFGKRIPGGAFVVVLVRNKTDAMGAFEGAIYVANEEKPPQKAPVVHGQGPGSGGRRATYPAPATQNRPTGFSPNGRKPVIPGTNEVAVLMKRGNCERLLALVKGQSPIHDAERPAIIRELETALGLGK